MTQSINFTYGVPDEIVVPITIDPISSCNRPYTYSVELPSSLAPYIEVSFQYQNGLVWRRNVSEIDANIRQLEIIISYNGLPLAVPEVEELVKVWLVQNCGFNDQNFIWVLDAEVFISDQISNDIPIRFVDIRSVENRPDNQFQVTWSRFFSGANYRVSITDENGNTQSSDLIDNTDLQAIIPMDINKDYVLETGLEYNIQVEALDINGNLLSISPPTPIRLEELPALLTADDIAIDYLGPPNNFWEIIIVSDEIWDEIVVDVFEPSTGSNVASQTFRYSPGSRYNFPISNDWFELTSDYWLNITPRRWATPVEYQTVFVSIGALTPVLPVNSGEEFLTQPRNQNNNPQDNRCELYYIMRWVPEMSGVRFRIRINNSDWITQVDSYARSNSLTTSEEEIKILPDLFDIPIAFGDIVLVQFQPVWNTTPAPYLHDEWIRVGTWISNCSSLVGTTPIPVNGQGGEDPVPVLGEADFSVAIVDRVTEQDTNFWFGITPLESDPRFQDFHIWYNVIQPMAEPVASDVEDMNPSIISYQNSTLSSIVPGNNNTPKQTFWVNNDNSLWEASLNQHLIQHRSDGVVTNYAPHDMKQLGSAVIKNIHALADNRLLVIWDNGTISIYDSSGWYLVDENWLWGNQSTGQARISQSVSNDDKVVILWSDNRISIFEKQGFTNWRALTPLDRVTNIINDAENDRILIFTDQPLLYWLDDDVWYRTRLNQPTKEGLIYSPQPIIRHQNGTISYYHEPYWYNYDPNVVKGLGPADKLPGNDLDLNSGLIFFPDSPGGNIQYNAATNTTTPTLGRPKIEGVEEQYFNIQINAGIVIGGGSRIGKSGHEQGLSWFYFLDHTLSVWYGEQDWRFYQLRAIEIKDVQVFQGEVVIWFEDDIISFYSTPGVPPTSLSLATLTGQTNYDGAIVSWSLNDKDIWLQLSDGWLIQFNPQNGMHRHPANSYGSSPINLLDADGEVAVVVSNNNVAVYTNQAWFNYELFATGPQEWMANWGWPIFWLRNLAGCVITINRNGTLIEQQYCQ